MKLLIAGSREFTDYDLMLQHLNHLIDEGFIIEEGLEIVCGMARGADMTGYAIALDNGLKVHEYFADWASNPRSAGYIRNAQMSQIADAAVVFWNGSSRGSKHMIETMNGLGKPCKVILI